MKVLKKHGKFSHATWNILIKSCGKKHDLSKVLEKIGSNMENFLRIFNFETEFYLDEPYASCN